LSRTRDLIRSIPGKWIRDLEPDMPAVEAAQTVLTLRLKAVERLIPIVVDEQDDAMYAVHQLRVASRRAASALRVFRPCLGKKSVKNAGKHLRGVRRAAGDARRLDVQIRDARAFRRHLAGGPRLLWEECIDSLLERRLDAYTSLRRTLKRIDEGDLKAMRKSLLRDLREPRIDDRRQRDDSRSVTFRALGDHTLPALVEETREAGRADLNDIENIHQLRIHSKRLRYALEIFACCQDEMFAARYERLEAFQESLGEINDADELLAEATSFVQSRLERRLDLMGDLAVDGEDARGPAGDVLMLTIRQRRDDDVRLFLDSWRAGAWNDLWMAADPASDDPRAGDADADGGSRLRVVP